MFFKGNSTNISPSEALKKMQEDGAICIDVRSREEHAGASVQGAKLICLNESNFNTELGKLDKNKTYLFLCASGMRSKRALGIAKELGFTNIYNIQGGISNWARSGLPVKG